MKSVLKILCALFLLQACKTDSSEDDPNTNKYFLSYRFDAGINNLESDIIGIIDEIEHTITLSEAIPANRTFIATFDAIGDVYVQNNIQISNVTANKYDDQFIYTIYAKDGSSVNYTLLFPVASSVGIKKYVLQIEQRGENITVIGEFSSDSSMITLTPDSNDWIHNVRIAKASFEAYGVVQVGQTVQISGETTNDFREDILYTIKGANGELKTHQVILRSPQSTGLPVISIHTENNTEITDKENYVSGNLSLDDVHYPLNELKESIGIRGRGNTTWGNPKKPYRIKFDKEVSLFGLGAAKSWVLLANYQDPTFIMNTVAFEIARQLGLEYTNHANHVELFLNDKYCGSYVLTEQVQVNQHRVNINEKTDFLVELDRHFDEDYKFKSSYLKIPVNIKSPELKSEDGMDFIIKAISNLENAIFKQTSEYHYSDLIDVPVLIDYILLNEIVANGELLWPKSTFMYKRQNEKIKMGPVWDFDWGFGYGKPDPVYFVNPQGMLYYKGECDFDPPGRAFFYAFFHDEEFVQAYRKQWNEKKGRLSDVEKLVENMGHYLERSAVENREEWDNGLDYSQQITSMKKWFRERINYLDQEINK